MHLPYAGGYWQGRKRKAGSDSGAVAAGGVGDSGGAAVDPTSKRGFQALLFAPFTTASASPPCCSNYARLFVSSWHTPLCDIMSLLGAKKPNASNTIRRDVKRRDVNCTHRDVNDHHI